MTNAESIDGSTDVLDPGMVRAGAAAAARRRELDISQRSLAADGIINAGALIAFEKGRSWPRERTRAKLEEVLRWPPGTIARLRRASPVAAEPRASPASDRRRGVADRAGGRHRRQHASARRSSRCRPSTIPPSRRASTTILADLRQLEAVAARAARIGRVTPALIKALSAVRTPLRRSDGACRRRAARHRSGSGCTPRGAARTSPSLETAQAAGVSEDDVIGGRGRGAGVACRRRGDRGVGRADRLSGAFSAVRGRGRRGSGSASASAAAISRNRRRAGGDISRVPSMTPPGRRCPSNGTSTTSWP